jgi:hypothetical protein
VKQTLFHVLVHCRHTLDQGKLTWRHDSVLNHISGFLGSAFVGKSMVKLSDQGWACGLCLIGVGARGHIVGSVKDRLRSLFRAWLPAGRGSGIGQMIKDVSRISLVCSFAMFQARGDPVWFSPRLVTQNIPQGFSYKIFTTKSLQEGEIDGLIGLLNLEVFRAVCPSVRPSVRWSVGPWGGRSVGLSVNLPIGPSFVDVTLAADLATDSCYNCCWGWCCSLCCEILQQNPETPSDIRSAIRLGDWAASIDLKDAYFHVPIAGDARKCLRFGWKGRLVQFCVLPFGLSPGGFQDQLSPARLSSGCTYHPLPGRHPGLEILLPALSLQHVGGTLHGDEGGLHHQLGEVQPRPSDRLPLPGDALGFGGGGAHPPGGQAGASSSPSRLSPSGVCPNVPSGPGLDRVCGSFSPGCATSEAEGPLCPALAELRLLFGSGSSEEVGSPPRSTPRPPVDRQSHVGGLSRSPLAPYGGRLRRQGPDRRIRQGGGVWFRGRLFSRKWDYTTIQTHIKWMASWCDDVFLG